MARVRGATVFPMRMVFNGSGVECGVRPSGVLPSVVVVVEVAAPFGSAAE